MDELMKWDHIPVPLGESVKVITKFLSIKI